MKQNSIWMPEEKGDSKTIQNSGVHLTFEVVDRQFSLNTRK
jgi:hypothetical protein